MVVELAIVSSILVGGHSESADAILKSRIDRHGRLDVSHRQIEFVRDAINTGNLQRIATVISPTGITTKFTGYSYIWVKPEIAPDVRISNDTKANWLSWAEGRIPPDTALAMTGLYEFCRFSISGTAFKWVKLDDRTWAQSRADFKYEGPLPYKLYPMWYIRLSNEKGRLWIKEYGYGSGEGE